MMKYTITPDVQQHAYHVTLELPTHGRQESFQMANWTSGSYLIRDFSTHVFNVKVNQGHVTQTKKNRWDVSDCDPDHPLILSWSVFANANRIHEVFFDERYGFINPAALFLHQVECLDDPVELVFKTPFAVHTTLRPTQAVHPFEEYAHHFEAATLEALLDTPFTLTAPSAPAQMVDFDVVGIPHRLVLTGAPAVDLSRLAADMTAICEKTIDLWRGAPFDHYLFHCHVGPNLYNGLEHQESCALQYEVDDLPGLGETSLPKGYADFLQLVAHEYFHAWLVKFLRPARYLPHYPLTGSEAYTELLWVFEGFTSYYEQRTPFLAGLMTEEEFLESLSKRFTGVLAREGFKQESLIDSSRLAWVHLYKQSANSPYQQTSYYGKGAIVAFFLDALIREASAGARSLDTLLADWFHAAQATPALRALPEDGFAALAESLGYPEVVDLVNRLTHTHDDALWTETWQQTAERFGLVSEPLYKSPLIAHWGLQLKEGSTTVSYTRSEGAAYQAGLFAGDEIIAIDGMRTSASRIERQIVQRLFATKPIAVTFFRRDQLQSVNIEPEATERFGTPQLKKAEAAAPTLGCESWLTPVLTA